MNTKHNVSKAYSLAAQAYSESLLHELEGKNFDRMILKWFATQISSDEKVLEIGAGPGQISGYLSQLGTCCIGTDISPQMVEQARHNFPDIQFEVQDFFELTFEDNTFFGVVGFYAIVNYPLEALKPIFEEMKRVLKHKGLFMFSFHIFEDEERTHVQNFFNHDACELDFYNYRVDEIKALVIGLGFEIVDLIIRYPYDGNEYASKRSYFVVRKN